MYFRDRTEAAEKLVQKLRSYEGTRPVVVCLPKASVPIANSVARHIGGELDLLFVHTISAPHDREMIVGAVAEQGTRFVDPMARSVGVSEEYLERASKRHQKAIQARRNLFLSGRPAINPKDRTVILVDDGLSSSALLRAGLAELRSQNPKKLLLAMVVAREEMVWHFKQIADEVMAVTWAEPYTPLDHYFLHLSEVSDEQVIQILEQPIKAEKGENTMRCRDIMSLRVYFCYENDPVTRCAEIMKTEGVGFVPVLNTQQRLIGVLTDRDIVTRVVAYGKPFETPVKEFISHEVVSCRPDDDLRAVEKMMRDKKKSRIPIVNEKGECMGVISLSDIARVETERQAGKILRDITLRESHLGSVVMV